MEQLQSPIKQAKQYRYDIIFLGRAHYVAGDIYYSKHNKIGVPTIILSTIVGTAIFSSLSKQNSNDTIKIIAGIFSLIAALLAALQTYFNFSELASKHRNVGSQYSALRRKLDMYILALETNDDINIPERVKELSQLSKEMSQLAINGLRLPNGSWDKAVKQIKKLKGDGVKMSSSNIDVTN